MFCAILLKKCIAIETLLAKQNDIKQKALDLELLFSVAKISLLMRKFDTIDKMDSNIWRLQSCWTLQVKVKSKEYYLGNFWCSPGILCSGIGFCSNERSRFFFVDKKCPVIVILMTFHFPSLPLCFLYYHSDNAKRIFLPPASKN